MKRIPLNQNKFVIVDDEDFESCKNIKWYISLGYARGRLSSGKSVMLHRFILKPDFTAQVDHINGDKLDCRRSNLRLSTNQQNSWNSTKRSGGTSRFKGVCWNKYRNRWIVYITKNKKHRYLGLFKNEEDAALAYDIAAVVNFGQFARCNLLT